MPKYRYDRETGQVIEKPERQREEVSPLPAPIIVPNWFREIYDEYLAAVRNGGPL